MRRLMSVLLSIATLSIPLVASPYQAIGLSLDIPYGWQVSGESKNWISLVATPQIATISITRLITETGFVPTPGALQSKRASIYFDGWMNLYSRDNTPTESIPLQAKSRRIAAYGKVWLNDQNKPVRRIVIEHYLVKPTVAYIVSIDVMETNWKQIEYPVKTLMTSLKESNLTP